MTSYAVVMKLNNRLMKRNQGHAKKDSFLSEFEFVFFLFSESIEWKIFVLSSFKCSGQASSASVNYVKGTKIFNACKKYMALAKPFNPPHTIIKGKTADIQEFPHMAALGYRNRDDTGYDFDCGASLISEQFVVTAAHCVKERRKPMIVRFGKVRFMTNNNWLIDWLLGFACNKQHFYFETDLSPFRIWRWCRSKYFGRKLFSDWFNAKTN